MNRELITVSLVAILTAVAGLAGALSEPPTVGTPGDAGPSHSVSRTTTHAAEHNSPQDSGRPSQLETEYTAGYTAFQKKHYATAIQIENHVIQQDATFEQAYNVKGIALVYDGKYDEGMHAIEKALQLNPEDGYARFNRALAFEVYGYYDNAITSYKQALHISHGEWWTAWCYYGIASIYGRRGDVANVVSYLKQAIQADPSTKQAAKTERDFDNVRHSSAFQQLIAG